MHRATVAPPPLSLSLSLSLSPSLIAIRIGGIELSSRWRGRDGGKCRMTWNSPDRLINDSGRVEERGGAGGDRQNIPTGAACIFFACIYHSGLCGVENKRNSGRGPHCPLPRCCQFSSAHNLPAPPPPPLPALRSSFMKFQQEEIGKKKRENLQHKTMKFQKNIYLFEMGGGGREGGRGRGKMS